MGADLPDSIPILLSKIETFTVDNKIIKEVVRKVPGLGHTGIVGQHGEVLGQWLQQVDVDAPERMKEPLALPPQSGVGVAFRSSLLVS